MKGYAHPETLVDTAWLEEHLGEPGLQVVEVDVDTKAYDAGPRPRRRRLELADAALRPGACATSSPKPALERLLAESGIGNDTTVVLYGDNNNWFAAWALLAARRCTATATCG